MSNLNKQVLISANEAISKGDYEGFLSYCTENTVWHFIGEQTLDGKEAVRAYMNDVYDEPPKFVVENLIAENEFVTAVGKISLKNEEGTLVEYAYCDIWRLRDGKLHELKAFVVGAK